MSRILVVEDEIHLAEGLRFNLEAEGYDVALAETGETALDLLRTAESPFALLILDVMLPGKDGFAVIGELRQRGQFIPTLMLTARGHAEDVLRGFEAGADDYLPKPFELPILLARIRGLLRRREWIEASFPSAPPPREAPEPPETVVFDGKSVHFDRLELRVGEQVFPLTLMEANVLRYLIEREGKPVSRKAMLEEVWGLHEDTDTRAIDNFIVRLRRYIEADPTKPRHLLTVRGVGYRFVRDSGGGVKRALLAWYALALALVWAAAPGEFRFAIVGDRTGETQPGVWERVWREVSASSPAFVLSVGDVIQGLDDATAESEWRELLATLAPYRKLPIYLTPGNHDVWSESSAELYRKHSGRPLHYSFDYAGAHFTVLDNSRSDALPAAEMDFLAADLAAHPAASARFIVMHRPSWIMDAALGNTGAPLHQLAKRYAVRSIVAGHVHQLIHAEVEGITYLAAPSAGGHLRLSRQPDDGWFFGWTEVEVKAGNASFTIHELEGRRTALAQWGLSGLRQR